MANDSKNLTTLCYIEKDDKYLMMHRVSKQNDVNHGKWEDVFLKASIRRGQSGSYRKNDIRLI